jgi:hypothetical protein
VDEQRCGSYSLKREKRKGPVKFFYIEDSIHLPRRKIIEYPKQEAALCGALHADYADQPHALILFVKRKFNFVALSARLCSDSFLVPQQKPLSFLPPLWRNVTSSCAIRRKNLFEAFSTYKISCPPVPMFCLWPLVTL